MKTKLYALALLAAIVYSSLVCIKAYADDVDVGFTDDQCVELRTAIENSFEELEAIESGGGIVTSVALGAVVQASIVYIDQCQARTGVLFEGDE